jgi:predicted TPR repeat methyltransferase
VSSDLKSNQSGHHFPDTLRYLRRLAAVYGFSIQSLESHAIRKNRDADVSGHLVVLRREQPIDRVQDVL